MNTSASKKTDDATPRLPTPRMSPRNQVELLCRCTELNPADGDEIRVQDAAKLMSISENHASLVSGFAVHCGFLTRGKKGFYIPTERLRQFAPLWRVGGERLAARTFLREALGGMWFAAEARSLLVSGPQPQELLILPRKST